MSEIISTTGRSISTVTAEIKVITRQTQQMLLNAAVEIGRRLEEAKAMVPFGEWGAYLEKEVEFSQSSANNFMRLYREYGDNQQNLFSPNSQAFENLPYTTALRLLAVPAEEREEFAKENDVAHKSTREVEELIRQRDEALQEKGEIGALLRESEGELEETQKEQERLRGELKKAQAEIKAAQASEKNMKETLAKAKLAERDAKVALKKLRENPEVPETVMERLRQEAQADAATKARQEAEGELKAAQEAARVAQEKLASTEKEMQLQNPDAAVFGAMFDQVQKDFEIMLNSLKNATEKDPATGQKLKTALFALLESLKSKVTE